MGSVHDHHLGGSKEQVVIVNTYDGTDTDWVTVFTPASGKKARVVSALITVSNLMVVRFGSGTTAIGELLVAQGEPAVLPHNPLGWFTTLAADDLLQVVGTEAQTLYLVANVQEIA